MMPPAIPKLWEEVLFLEATRDREEKLMEAQLQAIGTWVGLLEGSHSLPILELQLEFLWEAKAHFMEVSKLSLSIRAKDVTKQAQVDSFLDAKSIQLQDRVRAICMRVATLRLSPLGDTEQRRWRLLRVMLRESRLSTGQRIPPQLSLPHWRRRMIPTLR